MSLLTKRWRLFPILLVAVMMLCASLLVASPKEAKAATTYTVTASAKNFSGAAGGVSPATQTVNAGSDATITITLNAGYHVGSITDNGNLQNINIKNTSGNLYTYTIPNVQANHTLVVAFTKYEERHDYKSSVDGATLPCSISRPDPANIATPNKIPLMVVLHAFGGQGNGVLDAGDMFVLSPWGRNYKSMYSDGKATSRTAAPTIYDDFSASPSPNWTVPAGTGGIWKNGSWSATGGVYKQTDTAMGWTMSDRNDFIVNPDYKNYTVTVDLKEAATRTNSESCMGVFFRRNTSNNEGYLVDLDNAGGTILVRLWKYQAGQWIRLAQDPLMNNGAVVTENDAFWKNGINLKVQAFEDVIEVHINNQIWNLDASHQYAKDASSIDYGYGKGELSWGPRINDATFTKGSVALASFGGVHQFDNFRVQNEFLFGETDIIDCINQFIDEFSNDPAYRVDPTRIYLAGISMGGVGTWTLGFQHPDLFSALHPTVGMTDFIRAITWIKDYYPDAKGVQAPGTVPPVNLMEEQDGHIGETCDAFLGGADPTKPDEINDPDHTLFALLRSSLHECSARWIQENALYTPMRIEKPEYDSLLPNTLNSDMYVCFIGFHWIFVPYITMGRRYGPMKPNIAHDQAVWNDWYPNYPADVLPDGSSANGLTKCKQETSGYGENGELPPATPVQENFPCLTNIWDKWNYSSAVCYGGHMTSDVHNSAGIYPFNDIKFPVKILKFFQRANSAYYSTRVNPPTVAYRTYDLKHNSAWWLTVEAAYPNQESTDLAKEGQMAALARVANGRKKATPVNGADVHVKNVKTTTLDLTRMGIDTTNSSTTTTKALTFNLDNNTAPEAEVVTDTYGKTTLKLAGVWFPANWANYTVMLGTTNLKTKSSITGSVLTITDVPVTSTTSTLTVTVPKNVSGNMVNMFTANPGFELDAGWTVKLMGGTGTVGYENVEQAHSVTAANRTERIRNAKAVTTTNNAYLTYAEASPVAVTGGAKYTASAFVKTRSLQSITKVFSGGKYDPNVIPKAGVGIIFTDANGVVKSYSAFNGIGGSNDWTPLEVTATAPSGTNIRAKVIVFVKSYDAQGSTGSAFFDDAALRKGV